MHSISLQLKYSVQFWCLDNMDMSSYVKLTEFSMLYFSTNLSTSLNKLLLHVDVFEYGDMRHIRECKEERLASRSQREPSSILGLWRKMVILLAIEIS